MQQTFLVKLRVHGIVVRLIKIALALIAEDPDVLRYPNITKGIIEKLENQLQIRFSL